MRSIIFKTIKKLLSNYSSRIIERAKLTEHTFMIVIAIIIGAFAGFAAIGIRAMIKLISGISFPGNGTVLENIIGSPWFIVILVPVLGGLIVGPLIYFFAPEAKGHGVPEVMQAILLKGGKIRPRVAFVKAVASAITIGTGGSVGREGPIIQIGSSLGSMVGQFLKIPSKRLKTFVGCGAAAGIAAAFNAPIAGALFAVEIILMDFAVAQFSPIVISSVMATVISHSFEGDFAAFIVPKYQLASPYELIFYLILGVGCGLASWVFIKSLYFFEDHYDNKLKIPEFLKPMTGGLAIGFIGLLFPQIMGVGYDSINQALHGDLIWYFAFALVFIKILATSLTLGSGGSGGIFAPSLFMGAMLGEFFGSFIHSAFPEITGSPGAYALVAMGGLVAGTTRAPITAIIIVFELTNDYRIILPLMITCIISMIISTKLSRESIYTLKLLLRNIGIKEGMDVNAMESIFVKDVYSRDFDFIKITDNFNQILNKVVRGRGPEFPVLDKEGNIVGIISLYDIKYILSDKEIMKDLIIAEDLLSRNFEILSVDDNCQFALDKISKCGLEGLPVTENRDSKLILGMLWRNDIQEAYQKEIEQREISVTLGSSIIMKEEDKDYRFLDGYSVAEMPPPGSFIGKSIREMDVRARFGVDILSIKITDRQETKIKAIPGPEHVFAKEDILVVAGEVRSVNIFKNLD